MAFNFEWRKIIIFALIAIHAGWIVNHMRLVYFDRINPWRLGGYGMYTVPSIKFKIAVVDVSDPMNPKLIASNLIKIRGMFRATRLTNYGRTFRCYHVPDYALKAFFHDNHELIGRNIFLEYIDNKFEKKAPWFSIRSQGRIDISWFDNTTLKYKSQFCSGDVMTGVIKLT